mmetsp:Transcript_58947/g.140722  ORF Transcript_58947/g.140722 Transcript_58947/m.140722 type:complete len:290 (-) Transcript_58947:232-1101(-)
MVRERDLRAATAAAAGFGQKRPGSSAGTSTSSGNSRSRRASAGSSVRGGGAHHGSQAVRRANSVAGSAASPHFPSRCSSMSQAHSDTDRARKLTLYGFTSHHVESKGIPATSILPSDWPAKQSVQWWNHDKERPFCWQCGLHFVDDVDNVGHVKSRFVVWADHMLNSPVIEWAEQDSPQKSDRPHDLTPRTLRKARRLLGAASKAAEPTSLRGTGGTFAGEAASSFVDCGPVPPMLDPLDGLQEAQDAPQGQLLADVSSIPLRQQTILEEPDIQATTVSLGPAVASHKW